jgi:hypothetical protein
MKTALRSLRTWPSNVCRRNQMHPVVSRRMAPENARGAIREFQGALKNVEDRVGRSTIVWILREWRIPPSGDADRVPGCLAECATASPTIPPLFRRRGRTELLCFLAGCVRTCRRVVEPGWKLSPQTFVLSRTRSITRVYALARRRSHTSGRAAGSCCRSHRRRIASVMRFVTIPVTSAITMSLRSWRMSLR